MDSLFGGRSEQTYTVVPRKPSGVAASRPDAVGDGEWSWTGEPPTKENFVFEWGEHLEPGVRYLCVETQENGYSLQDPEWVVEAEESNDAATQEVQRLRNEVAEMRDAVESGEMQADELMTVEDEGQLQARLKGAVAVQGLQAADDVDDVVRILDAIGERAQPTPDPMTAMLTDAENSLEVSSPTDFAMLMMMPELKEVAQEGRQTLQNVSELTGSLSGGANAAEAMMGGGDDDQDDGKVAVPRDELERLRAAAEGEDTEAIETETEATTEEPEDEDTSGSLDAGDYLDEDDDDEPEPADPEEEVIDHDTPMSASPDEEFVDEDFEDVEEDSGGEPLTDDALEDDDDHDDTDEGEQATDQDTDETDDGTTEVEV